MLHLTTLFLVTLQAIPLPSESPPVPAGLWWGDFDADGLPDALALGRGVPARLFQNLGAGEFADVSLRAGLPELLGLTQALWQDVDTDGDLDLLCVGPAELTLLANEAGSLRDITAQAGLAERHGVLHARFLEFDGDGLDDLWLADGVAGTLLRRIGPARFEPAALELDAGGAAPALAALAAEPRPGEPTVRAPTDAVEGTDRARPSAERGRSAVPEGLTGSVSVSGTTAAPAVPVYGCVPMLKDQAVNGCLQASSVPTLGLLYPLSTELNVDLAGRVGMGTTLPTHRLTVQGQGNDDVLRLVGTQGSSLGYGAKLNLGDGDFVHLWEYDDDHLEIKAQDELLLTALGLPGEVNVASNVFNVAAPIVRFIGGRVGIGTTPAWPLDVLAGQAVAKLTSSSSTNGSVLELRNQAASPNSIGAINFVNAAGQFNGQIAYTGSDALIVRTNNAESLRVTSTGNVGIGITNPNRKLYVAGGGASAILGETTFSGGDGVYGSVNSTSVGAGWGVRGESRALGGQGVHGAALATSGQSHGVFGSTLSRDGAGVYGYNSANPTTGEPTVTGVYGEVDTARGQGVWGQNFETAQVNGTLPVGVLGTAASVGYAFFADGDIGATGSKSFLQPYPGDAGKMLRFVCLEGNEAGTYCRGSDALIDGRARIPLPEDFRLASARDELTAQLTPRGPARLWIEALTPDELVVRGDVDVPFDWFVNGVRRGFEGFETVRDNTAFVPVVRGLPFLQDRSEEFRHLLFEAGITNADGTPNEATAAALGWELLERDDPRAERWLPPSQRTEIAKPELASGADDR